LNDQAAARPALNGQAAARPVRRARWPLLLATAALGGVAAVAVAGGWLSRPAPASIGPPPADWRAVTVRLATADGSAVVGWFLRGQPGRGAVLLLHGVRADRRQMAARARFLAAAGHAVLLIDLPAHGESAGERITFGAREAAGVHAALDHLRRELPGERIGVIGVSLGAASFVLSGAGPTVHAAVLESMYPTIDDAVANRLAMRFGAPGRWLSPLLLWQLPLRLDVSAGRLRPLAAMPTLGVPVLVASGTHDLHTPWTETEQLFAAAAAPKELWAVEGAAHVDLCEHSPAAYQQRVGAFLAAHLATRSTAPAR
jgi:pimeloyl-ACP methyl ester carboxylesterase